MSAAAGRRALPASVPAEVSMLLVHLAVAVGFGRLYEGTDHLLDLFAFTVTAHVAAGLVRHLRAPLPVGVVVGVGGAALVSTWLLFPDTAAFGLPTATTLESAREAVEVAAEEFRTVAAPTAVLPGFQLLAGLALWGAAWFADWAAFRLRATAEALAPATIIFIFCTVLGAGDERVLSAVLFAGAVVLFVANHRAHMAELDNAWLATNPREGARSVRRAALTMGVTVVAVGAVATPLLPGFDDEAVVTWRGRDDGGGLRTTVSPIVDLHRRLVSQSNRNMFQVEASQPAYWRLTSLHEFDGRIWSSGGSYGKVGEELPTEQPPAPRSDLIVQTIRIQNLSAIWVPAAFEARVVEQHNKGLNWDPDSSTLIVDSGSPNSDGLVYTVTSERPTLEPDVLAAAAGEDPEEVRSRYLPLPGDFPELARTEARGATARARNRYEQARALQDYFQDGSFTYTTEIEPGHGNDALVAFLQDRRGYCEQFAGAYAAMARSLGIPARVAVGFTQGEADPANPGRYQVRGVHAHAWPEVYFPGHGWVPFEPTPGRGIPGAERYTGLLPSQAPPNSPSTTVSVVTTTSPTSLPQSTTSPTSSPDEVPVRGTIIEPRDVEEPSRWGSVARWLALLVLSWLVVVLAAPRVRRAARDRTTPERAVLASWHDALEPLRWTTGARPRASETHRAFAHRVAPVLDDEATLLVRLADLVERAAWDPTPVTEREAAKAGELADQLRSALRRREPVAARVRRRLSWREAFGAGRARPDRTSRPEPADDQEREPAPVG